MRFPKLRSVAIVERMKMGKLGQFRRVLCFGLFVGFILLLSISPARASIESRLSNLEADFNRLERQVDRLGTQVQRWSRGLNREPSNSTVTPSVADAESSVLTDDPMFDRLATLVIELKQRLDGLEARLEELESRDSDG